MALNDDSVLFLKENHPKISIISLSENLGLAGGYNEGLKKVNSKYFILVNSDIEVTKSWINPLIKVLRNNHNIVAVQPKILSYENKTHFEHAGAAGGFLDRYGYPFCRGRIFNFTEKDGRQYDDYQEIFWASGACLAVKAEEFKKIGGFDSSFFAHMEEIDLCWRFKNLGKNIFYTSESLVYHVGGGTLNYNSPNKIFLNYRNNLWMIHKNYLSSNSLLYFIFIRLLLDQISALKLLFSGNIKSFIAIEKAHFEYIKSLNKIQKKRNSTIKININSSKGILKIQLFGNYFFKGKKGFLKLSQIIKYL